jgi:hypothetical protein
MCLQCSMLSAPVLFVCILLPLPETCVLAVHVLVVLFVAVAVLQLLPVWARK